MGNFAACGQGNLQKGRQARFSGQSLLLLVFCRFDAVVMCLHFAWKCAGYFICNVQDAPDRLLCALPHAGTPRKPFPSWRGWPARLDVDVALRPVTRPVLVYCRRFQRSFGYFSDGWRGLAEPEFHSAQAPNWLVS